jgi:hypothetical protein
VVLHVDWLVVVVDDESVVVEHDGVRGAIGLDGVRAYFSDPNRDTPTQKFGWLQLLVQVDVTSDGRFEIAPLPLGALSQPPANPLDTDTGRLAAQQYRSLWPAGRAAIAHLLIAGDATSQQVFQALLPTGPTDLDSNTLARIALATQLVHRVEASDSKETLLLGYRGRYTINARFRAALEQLVADDEDVRDVMSRLR